jgi:hypothetical protein
MPTITNASRVAILCALLLLVLAVACAPVAPPESPLGEDPNEQSDKPDSDESGDEKLTPTPKPTSPPQPTPKPDRDSDGKPEPTRHPDNPPSPTTEPTSPPGPITPASAPVDPMPQHPDGMAGCYSMNLYQMPVDEVPFMFWCQRVLSEDVAQNCQGTGEGTTEDEKKCGIQRLAEVQVFMMREFVAPCSGITISSDRIQCVADTGEALNAHYQALLGVYAEILKAVTDKSEVKTRASVTAECVRAAGYEPFDTTRPLSWQEMRPPSQASDKRVTPEEQDATNDQRNRAIDQCAFDEGLYEAQESAWLAEIEGMRTSDPDKAERLKQEGIITALEAEGIALFLTFQLPVDYPGIGR